MSDTIRVLGISGSLRRNSYNTGLLRAAAELLPEGMTLETFDLAPIPPFNQDILDTSGPPEPVKQFKARIAAADALLIATPEYNYSIPGVLKNAIDWASRPVQDSPLNGKPLSIMGAGGVMGTSRAQYHLRQVAVFTNMLPLNKPEVMVQRSQEKFDAKGNLTDEPTRQQIRALLEALSAWTRRLRGR
jgi:chromate reductase